MQHETMIGDDNVLYSESLTHWFSEWTNDRALFLGNCYNVVPL